MMRAAAVGLLALMMLGYLVLRYGEGQSYEGEMVFFHCTESERKPNSCTVRDGFPFPRFDSWQSPVSDVNATGSETKPGVATHSVVRLSLGVDREEYGESSLEDIVFRWTYVEFHSRDLLQYLKNEKIGINSDDVNFWPWEKLVPPDADPMEKGRSTLDAIRRAPSWIPREVLTREHYLAYLDSGVLFRGERAGQYFWVSY